MADVLKEIIDYLVKINTLREGEIIKIGNKFYEFIQYFSENGMIYLKLYDLDLNIDDELTKEEVEYEVNIYEREICFEGKDFDIKKEKYLLEEIVKNYKSN